MKPSANELLLALRSPSSGWLATLICALDEALRDGAFTPHQRELLRGVIESGNIPPAVVRAAEAGVHRFEQQLSDLMDDASAHGETSSNAQVQRPKLTLVGSAAA